MKQKVNEETIWFAIRSYKTKWASCKGYNIINSITNTGQSDLKKTFPSS